LSKPKLKKSCRADKEEEEEVYTQLILLMMSSKPDRNTLRLIVVFKLSPCCIYGIFSSGYFPGV
jgi:hypothetical protein